MEYSGEITLTDKDNNNTTANMNKQVLVQHTLGGDTTVIDELRPKKNLDTTKDMIYYYYKST